MSLFRRILVPVDFSEHSRLAFRLAAAVGRDHHARLLVLHVHAVVGAYVAYGDAMAQLEPPGHRAKLQEVLAHYRVEEGNVAVDHQLVDGDAGAEILRSAQDSAAELIVMGSHGRTGLGRMLLGSVAEQVMRRARCPVLTVKVPHANGARLAPS